MEEAPWPSLAGLCAALGQGDKSHHRGIVVWRQGHGVVEHAGSEKHICDTTAGMKSSMLPQVRVPEELRSAAESVLAQGETLSSFIQKSVERAVDFRRIQAEFHARGEAALEHYKRTGVHHSVDEVVAGLQAKLDGKRKQLLG